MNKTRIGVYKKQIQILNNFVYLYWCLRFKTQFKKWLWEKIREPKIMKQYHPSNLFEDLQEDTDLDKFVFTPFNISNADYL